MYFNTAQLFQTSAILAATGPLTQYRGMVQELYTACHRQPEMHLGELVTTGLEFRQQLRELTALKRMVHVVLLKNVDEVLLDLEHLPVKQTGELLRSQILIDSLIQTLALPNSNASTEIDRHAAENFGLVDIPTEVEEEPLHDARQTREMGIKTILGLAAIEEPTQAIEISVGTYIVSRSEDEPDKIAPEPLPKQVSPQAASIARDDSGYILRRSEVSGETHASDFRFVKWLASGGEGHVYLTVEHMIGDVERSAVLKVVDSASRQQVAMDRFETEVDLLKDNPTGAIQIYRAGRTSSGAPFLAMEFASQGTLTEYFPKQQRSMDEIIDISRRIIHTVATACHERGIVHRDIKPDNYLVFEDGTIKLADFGIALRLDDFVPPKKGEEKLNCTLEYAPYESLLCEPPDPRQDVYSLGAMLYELLTDELPYPRASGQSPLAYITHRILNTDPPPSPRKLNRKVPVWLSELVMRALSHEANDRYVDAASMLADFVTYKARKLEKEAREGKMQPRHSQVPITIREAHRFAATEQDRIDKQWEMKMSAALREFEEAYRLYPLALILNKIVDVHFEQWEYADKHGIDRLIKASSDFLLRQLDESDDRYQRVAQTINLEFKYDGRLPRAAEPKIILTHAENIGGYLNNFKYPVRAFSEIPQGHQRFIRGGASRFTLIAKGLMPVALPLQARPGRNTVRVPIYPLNKIPLWARNSSLLIPAGSVAVWKGQKSYSASIPTADIRYVAQDFLLHPLITNAQWEQFLRNFFENYGEQEALRHVPYDSNGPLWRWDKSRMGGTYVDRSGEIPHPDLPIYNISVLSTKHFMTQEMPGAELPTLDQLKLATRGLDLRKWTWGDADPDHGEAALAIIGQASEPVPVSEPMLDSSPYSIVDEHGNDIRRINHMVGNVERFFQVPEDHQHRIFSYFKPKIEELFMKKLSELTDEEKHQIVWTYAAAYDTQPRNAEIIHPYRQDIVGKIGLMPIYNLGRP